MKTIKELTKTELEGMCFKHLDAPFSEPCAECASCGTTDKAPFYYICDACNGITDAELARLRRELAERDERISEAVKAWRMGKISALKLADLLEGKK